MLTTDEMLALIEEHIWVLPEYRAHIESLDRGQLAEECCQQLRGIVPEEVLEQVRQTAPWLFNRS